MYLHTNHTLLTHYSHTIHTLLAHYSHTTRTLFTHYSHTIHTLLAHYSHTTRTPPGKGRSLTFLHGEDPTDAVVADPGQRLGEVVVGALPREVCVWGTVQSCERSYSRSQLHNVHPVYKHTYTTRSSPGLDPLEKMEVDNRSANDF